MAIKGSLSQFSQPGESQFQGFSGRLAERQKKRQEEESYQKKIDSYKQGFFEVLGDQNRSNLLSSLKKRADRGDTLAQERYNAIIGDERIKQAAPTSQSIQPLSFAERASQAIVGALPVQAIGNEVSGKFKYFTGKERPEGRIDGKTLIAAQQKARALPADIQETARNIGPSATAQVLGLVNRGVKEDEIRAFVTRAAEEKRKQDLKTLGTAAEVASLGVGGGSLTQAFRAGGLKQAAKAGLTTTAAGATGGAGYTLRENPAATGQEIAANAGLGAGFGLGGSLAAAGAGKLAREANNLAIPTITETRLGSKVAQTRTAQKITDLKDRFVAKVVDDTNYIKKPFRGLTNSATGQKITDEIEQLVTNVRQFAGKAQDRLQNNQSFQELRPLIAGDKKLYKDYGDFIRLKQDAVNRNKLIAAGKVDGAPVRVPTGTPEQERAYTLLNQATKDDIKYLYDNGLIDQNKYQQWIDDPDYTRVQREIDNDFTKRFGSGLGSASRVTDQKLKGSTKSAVDPFAAYEDWQRRITLEVERNNLRKYIRDQGIKYGKSNEVDTTSVGIERIRQLYGEEGVQQQTLPVFEKGMKQLYTIDPRAARQLAGASDLELRAVADWVLFPSRVLRGGATSMNAAFAVPNFIRDQLSSAIISKNARATHNPIAFWAGFKEAILKPTGRATLGRVPGVSKELFQPSPMFKEYLARNNNMTSVDLARNLKGATRQAQENLGVRGESIIRRYENIISASEKATRYQSFIGTYRNAIKKGVDSEEAVKQANAAARTNSINFSNRGEIATFAKIFNPYFNAGVQGSRTLASAFKNRPLGTSAKIGVGVLAPVATSTYYNLSDPERAEIYARIPDYERKGNLIMVLGGNRGYIKVPLPPGIREFSNPLRNYIESEYLGDRQGLLETAKDLFVDPFSPVGTTGREVLSQAVPQAIKPAVELGMNKDLYTGRDIIPENLKNAPKDEQVFDSTPQIYRDIAKAVGVSPLQVRKVVTGYGAGGVEGALATLDKARGKNSGNRSTAEQIVKRFYSQNPSDSSNQVKSTFYETYTPLKGKKESISKKVTEALKNDDEDKANKLAAELNDEIEREKQRLRQTYGKFETDLTALYDQFDTLKFPLEDGQLSQRSIKSRLKDKK